MPLVHWLKPPIPWKRGPLITADANCVSHVYFRNGVLVDAKGVAWTQVGTVPQVAASGKVPPGAGPFAAANYYRTTATADVFDFTGDFTLAAIVTASGNGSGQHIINASNDGTLGWNLFVNSTGTARISAYGVGTPATANTFPAGVPSVVCMGRSGTTWYVRLNTGSTVSLSGTHAGAASAITTRLGLNQSNAGPLSTTLHELYATTTAWSEDGVTALIAAARAKMGL